MQHALEVFVVCNLRMNGGFGRTTVNCVNLTEELPVLQTLREYNVIAGEML